jgi:hypothetical protein
MFPPDFKELLSVFNTRNVRYLLVGGYAVSLHAQPRATKDLDLWVSPDPANAQAVFSALSEFGAPLNGLAVADFTDPNTFFHMGTAPLAVDILLSIQGVDFNAAWDRRVEIEIDAEKGLCVPVISSEDLITAKLASSRTQDLADAEALREAAQTRR